MTRDRFITALATLSLFLTASPLHAGEEQNPHEGHDHTPMEAATVSHEHSLFHLDAEWQSRDGGTLTLSDLAGRPSIITMIYGSCETACPILIRDAQRIRAALPETERESVQVVVVSFDPMRDTPEAMAEYARQKVDNDRDWHFLHGSDADIRTLATLLGIRYRNNGDGTFDHSNVVAVLDGAGRIAHRGEGLMQPVDGPVQAILNDL